MEIRVIGFISPIIGCEGSFNTFRLGLSYFKKLKVGDEILLLDEKERLVFGRAVVEALDSGGLGDMCLIYAAKNHTELAKPPEDSPASLFRTIQRIYGPHIATVAKKTTVISLKRIE